MCQRTANPLLSALCSSFRDVGPAVRSLKYCMKAGLLSLADAAFRQMTSLRDAIAELNQWRADHEDVIRPLGMYDGLALLEPLAPSSTSTTNSDNESSPTRKKKNSEQKRSAEPVALTSMDIDSSSRRDREESVRGDVAGGQVAESQLITKMTQQSLSACVNAAEKLAVGRSLKEVRDMRQVLQNVSDWMEQCQSLCPRRQSKRRIQPDNKPTFSRLESFIAKGLDFPVGVWEDVSRIRSHMQQADSWQQNARSVLESISKSFATQTMERMELWRKEEEKEQKSKTSPAKDAADKERWSKDNSTVGHDAPAHKTSDAAEDTSQVKKTLPIKEVQDGAEERKSNSFEEEGESLDEDGSSSIDREDELDEAEEAHEAALEQLLTTARDISVFMPEELVTERLQRILEWARWGAS